MELSITWKGLGVIFTGKGSLLSLMFYLFPSCFLSLFLKFLLIFSQKLLDPLLLLVLIYNNNVVEGGFTT